MPGLVPTDGPLGHLCSFLEYRLVQDGRATTKADQILTEIRYHSHSRHIGRIHPESVEADGGAM
jgi:hypothetical protein